MKLLKSFTKLKPELQLLAIVALIVILSSLFWKSASQPFSIGASAHIGNLKGKVELEAFEGDRRDDEYIYRKKAFVLFHVPWCGYCRNVVPIWDQLAQKYNNRDVNVMKIDCEKFSNMAQKHQIDAYPTIRFYPNGIQDHKNYITYIDSRDLSSFSRFLEEHSEGRVGQVRAMETFQSANNYSAPVGYNDYEIFEPFATGEANDDDEGESRQPDNGAGDCEDDWYLKYMAGGAPRPQGLVKAGPMRQM